MTQQLSAVHRWAETLSGFGLGGASEASPPKFLPWHQFLSRHSSSYSRSGTASSKVDTSC